MTETKYREALEQAKIDMAQAKKELADCQQQQQQLEKRISGLREFIVATSAMLDEDFVDESQLGLTEAIRKAYRTAKDGGGLSTWGVERRRSKLGFNLDK